MIQANIVLSRRVLQWLHFNHLQFNHRNPMKAIPSVWGYSGILLFRAPFLLLTCWFLVGTGYSYETTQDMAGQILSQPTCRFVFVLGVDVKTP